MRKNNLILLLPLLFLVVCCCKRETTTTKESKLQEIITRDSANIQALLELGIYYHDQGKPEKAIDLFNKVLILDENNPTAQVYLGSSYTILADKSPKVEDKLRYLEKGTRILDETVKKFPDNYTVRLVRGINSVHLPDMFGRFRLAIEDLEYLLKDEAKVPKKDLTMILQFLAKAYKKDNQPAKALEIQKRIAELESNK